MSNSHIEGQLLTEEQQTYVNEAIEAISDLPGAKILDGCLELIRVCGPQYALSIAISALVGMYLDDPANAEQDLNEVLKHCALRLFSQCVAAKVTSSSPEELEGLKEIMIKAHEARDAKRKDNNVYVMPGTTVH